MGAAQKEGGYGWVIAGCFVCNMSCSIQLIQMMGLVLKDIFKELAISDREGATILTTNGAISLGLGLLAGPLIGRYGFRIVASAGAVLTATGMALSSTATAYHELFIYYGVIMSAGMSLTYPSYIVALNTYFKARRTLAMGVALSLTGASAILTPQLINGVSAYYTPRPALLVLAALSLQTLVGAVLLRPLPGPRCASIPPSPGEREEKDGVLRQPDDTTTPMLVEAPAPTTVLEEEKKDRDVKKHSAKAKGFSLAALFDLELMTSPAFVNLVVGTSLGMFADINLVMFLPFILSGLDFSTQECAVFMSVFGLTDTVCRLAAPLLHRVSGRPCRFMYLTTLIVIMVTRTGMAWCRSYTAVMVAVALTGASRGVNVVFLQTVIPANVAVERLASAQGIFMMTNGILFFTAGPAMGWLVGWTKNYNAVLAVLLIMNALTMVLWGAEDTLNAIKRRKAAKNDIL